MTSLNKKSTIYLDPDLHKALRLKSAETSRSISDMINEAVRLALTEDADDLASFQERANAPLISFEEALKELKLRGKI